VTDTAGFSRRSAQHSETPIILLAADEVVTGWGFLPEHEVTVRISYSADDVSDYITCTTDAHGRLSVVLNCSPTDGVRHISATDYRRDAESRDGLLWSNVETIDSGCR
jgi:hypothetical protein